MKSRIAKIRQMMSRIARVRQIMSMIVQTPRMLSRIDDMISRIVQIQTDDV